MSTEIRFLNVMLSVVLWLEFCIALSLFLFYRLFVNLSLLGCFALSISIMDVLLSLRLPSFTTTVYSYYVMLCRAQLCHSLSSICLSVCDVQIL